MVVTRQSNHNYGIFSTYNGNGSRRRGSTSKRSKSTTNQSTNDEEFLSSSSSFDKNNSPDEMKANNRHNSMNMNNGPFADMDGEGDGDGDSDGGTNNFFDDSNPKRYRSRASSSSSLSSSQGSSSTPIEMKDDENITKPTKIKQFIKKTMTFITGPSSFFFSSASINPGKSNPYRRLSTSSSSSSSSRHTNASTASNTSTIRRATTIIKQLQQQFYLLSVRQIIIILVILSITAFLAVFVQAILQLVTYRRNFGNAPIPDSPLHGIIVAQPYSSNNSNSKSDLFTNGNANSHDSVGGDNQNEHHSTKYTFKAYTPFHTISSALSEGSSNSDRRKHSQQLLTPLRLLVIGDSIARGVGQTNTCSPILPQSIAKYLSRHLNSRPVYWTSMAEPGASTKWLWQLVEEDLYRQKKQKRKIKETGTKSSSFSLKQFKEMHSILNEETKHENRKNGMISEQQWVQYLEYHEQLYTQSPFGDYDVIVVMSGLNDLKRIMVPFMLDDEIVERDDIDGEIDLHTDSLDINGSFKKEKGFAADMQRLIQLLNMGYSEDEHQQLSSSPNSESTTEQSCLLSNQKQQHLPTILFPQFPTKSNPLKVPRLLRKSCQWSSELMDKIKVRIATKFTNVISPEAPALQDGLDYVLNRLTANDSNTSINRENVHTKEVMINLISINCEDCKKKEEKMSAFHSRVNTTDFVEASPITKLFGPDGVHPNEHGYDFFGERLGEEILKKWDHDNLS